MTRFQEVIKANEVSGEQMLQNALQDKSRIRRRIESEVINLYQLDCGIEGDDDVTWEEFASPRGTMASPSVFSEQVVKDKMVHSPEAAIAILENPNSDYLQILCAQYYVSRFKIDKIVQMYGLEKPRKPGDPISDEPYIVFPD